MDAQSTVPANIDHTRIKKRAISNASVLNEAYMEPKPCSYSRGMRIELNGLTVLLISGTFSNDEHGKTAHVGDLRGQVRRTFENISGLLASEGSTWHDVVRPTCYLRDIDRDYDEFNLARTAFYNELNLNPLPASTGVQARLSRPELLVEIEAIVMFQTRDNVGNSGQ